MAVCKQPMMEYYKYGLDTTGEGCCSSKHDSIKHGHFQGRKFPLSWDKKLLEQVAMHHVPRFSTEYLFTQVGSTSKNCIPKFAQYADHTHATSSTSLLRPVARRSRPVGCWPYVLASYMGNQLNASPNPAPQKTRCVGNITPLRIHVGGTITVRKHISLAFYWEYSHWAVVSSLKSQSVDSLPSHTQAITQSWVWMKAASNALEQKSRSLRSRQ